MVRARVRRLDLAVAGVDPEVVAANGQAAVRLPEARSLDHLVRARLGCQAQGQVRVRVGRGSGRGSGLGLGLGFGVGSPRAIAPSGTTRWARRCRWRAPG
eukprot:scaffold108487_cov42-Phaeocystis_antarctica.AAC.1